MSHSNVGRSLAALRDVAGVHGSFVLRPTGELVEKDLPSVFHDDLFVDVGARLSRFVETMATDGDEVASATFRFDEQRLYVSRFPYGLLAVITANEVNTAALRMALTLTARRIEPEMAALLSSPPPPATVSVPASVVSSGGSEPRAHRGRVLPG
jgi:predicted regulator of Ras-like GTPase activity (Roadblock/LC7/MglB family)